MTFTINVVYTGKGKEVQFLKDKCRQKDVKQNLQSYINRAFVCFIARRSSNEP